MTPESIPSFATHVVTNQPASLSPYDAWQTDIALQQAIHREGAGWAVDRLAAYGSIVGSEMVELGFAANENKPRFRPYDAYGHRIDEVEFHPAYHRLMALGIAHGVSGFAWRHADTAGAHVARAGLMYLHGQPDQGTCCPLTMTYASVAALRHRPGLADAWMPRITSVHYDSRPIPAWEKRGNTIGMGMTEKQGGSDVRANTTRAERMGSASEATYSLVGHKWFLSAPMCDAFLVLAQTDFRPGGLTCFLVPRFAPDGAKNRVHLQRLKDKLGDWSNASAEVEFEGAFGWRIGDEGRGIATILEMVALTRQDCMIGSAAIMRQALVQAIHHARGRRAFGRLLIDQPLMRSVLADLALESEAAMLFSLRVARSVDASHRDPAEAAFARVATAIGKYWVCKRGPPFVNEAQECLGGAGYVEESILPRLYRQAPLNSIWEGSGNIQCLDVLRSLSREPSTRDALYTEFATVRGRDARLDRHIVAIEDMLRNPLDEARSRTIVEALALALQATLMLGVVEAPAVGEACCAARLGPDVARCYGTIGEAFVATLIDRAF